MKKLTLIFVLLLTLPLLAQDNVAASKKKPRQGARIEFVGRATYLVYQSRFGDSGLFLVRLNKKEKTYKRYLVLLKDWELRQSFGLGTLWGEIFEIRGKLIGTRKGTDVIDPSEIIQLTKRNETLVGEIVYDSEAQ